MDRKEFIKLCGVGCLGLATMSLLQSCGGMKYYTAALENGALKIPLSAFEGGEKKHLPHVIAQNDQLQYPVCVYRFGEKEYSALLMQCTHQGAELQVFGDRLQCPAHGSEFTAKGEVQNGPADQHLRTFEVLIENEYIRVLLK
ncbi:Rieske (2Fe-2S) protein [Oscillatoria amoena NRMC-F 0135]|nr:Rieske (2Fe-2S) protein [Oscillatoria amoena NRMC-F 0135]